MLLMLREAGSDTDFFHAIPKRALRFRGPGGGSLGAKSQKVCKKSFRKRFEKSERKPIFRLAL